jgi:peptidoglycan/LPS O-acetylase OafA/YrhL
MRPTPSRLAFIDALKGIASQLIVLHHIAFYGPMSDVANELAPDTLAWLSQNARIAVQVFLVIGGFLAARALAPSGIFKQGSPLATLKKRYFKLIIPFGAALLLSIACAAIARHWMQHDSIPAVPTIKQFLAHLALLHSLLGVDALSTGVWYIAIDFQLFALLLGILWLSQRLGSRVAKRIGLALVSLTTVASLFYFNRDAAWDNWSLYFFGAYGLGALTCWITEQENRITWMSAMAAVVIAALVVDFRTRIAVALLTALALGVSTTLGFLDAWPNSRLLAYLGKISYSVFLAHFPIVMVVNAAFTHFAPGDVAANGCGIIIAWLTSLAAGAAFYHYVESRSNRLQELLTAPVRRLLRHEPAFRASH